MNIEKMTKELHATLDANLAAIKKAAGKMDFDNMWEHLALFHVVKKLHNYLTGSYDFDARQFRTLLPLEYPLFALADYYRDIEDEDTMFGELVDYAVSEIRAGSYFYSMDRLRIAEALKN